MAQRKYCSVLSVVVGVEETTVSCEPILSVGPKYSKKEKVWCPTEKKCGSPYNHQMIYF